MVNFFSLLSEVDIKCINLAIVKDAQNCMSVVVSCPNGTSDVALNLLSPLYLTGTCKELDDNFFKIITEPLNKTQAMINNVNSYNKRLEEVKNETSEEKDRLKKIGVLKEKIKAIVDAKNYNPVEEKEKVLSFVAKILEIEPDNSYAKKIKEELLKKTSEGSLFSEINQEVE